MANTKVTKAVLADDAVGLAQLDISNDPSNGQALTYVATSNDLQWATISGGASDINGLSDAKTFGTSSIMIGDTTTGTIDAANYNTGVGVDVFAALTSGDDNCAYGVGAVKTLTSGSQNTGVGVLAGSSYSTSTFNTSLGYRAHGSGSTQTGSYNTAVGAYALDVQTTGSSCVGVGYGAGSALTTGGNNTFIGANSGENATTTSNNTSCGNSALNALTTGTQNNAFGHASLGSCTTGNYNCAFGQASLNALTTGTDNCAFGDNALQFGTTGSSNIGIGTSALRNCTTGGNISIGYGSGISTTSGDASVTMGYEAGEDKTTGAHLTAIGYRAAMNATTGNYNTIMGSNSAPSMTTPNYNTLLGYNAGGGSYPLTTGSSCTMVGALARPSGTAGTANNENVFGFNMAANGAGTTTLGAGGSGLYASHGSSGWTAISDERYKKDIVDSEVGLSFINDLKVRNFKWKTCGEVPSNTPKYKEGSNELIHETMTGVMHGFIAQEVKEVIDNHSEVPDNQLIWKQNPDGIQNLSKEELVPVLVKAVQELSAEVQQLKNKLQGE